MRSGRSCAAGMDERKPGRCSWPFVQVGEKVPPKAAGQWVSAPPWLPRSRQNRIKDQRPRSAPWGDGPFGPGRFVADQVMIVLPLWLAVARSAGVEQGIVVGPDQARHLVRRQGPEQGPPGRGGRSCRVALGSYPPRAPTDPDVRNCRSRLVRSTLHTRRYTEWTTRAAGSGICSSNPHRLAQPRRPFPLCRESHFRHTRATIALIRFNEEQFPVTP
jgi:hypothetical protein